MRSLRFDLTEVNDKRKNIAFLSECFRAKEKAEKDFLLGFTVMIYSIFQR